MLAAILAALYYVQQGLWMSGERDTYVSIMLLAAFYLALDRRKPMLVGALCTMAFLFRPTYAPYAAIFLIWYLLPFRESRRKVWQYIWGTAIPIIPCIVLYAALGGLKDFWDATILFNLKVYGGAGAAFNLWEPIRFYWVALIGASVAIVYVWKNDRPALYLWAALFAASVLSLLMLYRHSVYHYHPAMTLFLLISAVGWIRIDDRLSSKFHPRNPAKHRFSFIGSGIVILIGFYSLWTTFRGNTIQHVLADIATGRIHSLQESYDRYEDSQEFGVRTQTHVADYLIAHTHPNDTVQMFGPYSYPQYRARVITASRFQTLHAITMRGAGDWLQYFQQSWRKEYMQDMRRAKPIYFIVCDAPEAFRQYYGGRLGHEILRDDFQELGHWLDSNYTPETKIGAFTLYRVR